MQRQVQKIKVRLYKLLDSSNHEACMTMYDEFLRGTMLECLQACSEQFANQIKNEFTTFKTSVLSQAA